MALIVGPPRLLAMLALLAAGLLIAALIFPWLAQPSRNRVIGVWSRALVAVCGLRVDVVGRLPDELARTGILAGRAGRLLLANHVSWIDIFALNAALPIRFVAKAEIGRWPVMGTLVTLAGTLYIERGRRHAVHAINQKVSERLVAGESVAVFPEGTTSDGGTLLPFHSNLVAPALEVRCEVWPVALRYTQHGRPTRVPAFIGQTTLVESIWRIVGARGLAIEIAFLPPVATDEQPQPTRHRVAQAAHAAIAQHLGLPAEAPAHRPVGGERPRTDKEPATHA
jgi:1-acyl-sn-glycerol-3-phosphate acyltransferase